MTQTDRSLTPSVPAHRPSSWRTRRLPHGEAVTTALEQAAAFGRWWLDRTTGHCMISPQAAVYLDVAPGEHPQLDECLIHVVADDAAGLAALIAAAQTRACKGDQSHEFRVIDSVHGMRWLRATTLASDPLQPELLSGVLIDITQIKHAAVRERLGFELTEYLVGTHTLGDAIINVIQLICKNLGWEWGAYWALEESASTGPLLRCKHYWHQPNYDLGAFSGASGTLCMAPGQGLVGRVWQTGSPEWVEDMSQDPRFLRRASAADCGLWSGYIFPVTYVSDSGEQHRPGVLEFYSSLSRQPEAQLPKLSATIGALIAQTAQHLEKEAVIHHLAHVDELTELANRSHFHAQLNQRCTHAVKTRGHFALMFIDLDRFKPINDAFGHDAGNVVLREFARRLKAVVPSGASVGRLGGDEFALLVPGLGEDELAQLVQEVLAAARAPFLYEGVELTVSASIGVSRFPDNGLTSPELLRSADAAMYRVKQNGRNGCDVFSTTSPVALAQQRASLAQRLAIETDLHHALQANALFLVYQPIFDLTEGRMHGLEALVRWRRADGVLVPPDMFIPIAEQSHLIVDIGQWVIAQACRDLATLQQARFDDLKIHVNMAASEFTNSALPDTLQALTREHGVAPSSLVLELTEGMLMKQPDQVIAVMHKLRRVGFDISLDDFGMGHSSLSLLKKLPISSLKIDRSFVRDLPQQALDRAITQTIVDMGHHMRLDVIAEGVETEAQLSVLRDIGCHLTQGFLLSRPLAVGDLIHSFPGGALPAPARKLGLPPANAVPLHAARPSRTASRRA